MAQRGSLLPLRHARTSLLSDDMITNELLQPLAELLKRRLAVIGDTALRDVDPQAHLNALREASEAIDAEHSRLKPHLPPRLRHFLEQASDQKALDYISRQEE